MMILCMCRVSMPPMHPCVCDLVQGWLFRYEAPVLVDVAFDVGTAGGDIILTGYNFGNSGYPHGVPTATLMNPTNNGAQVRRFLLSLSLLVSLPLPASSSPCLALSLSLTPSLTLCARVCLPLTLWVRV